MMSETEATLDDEMSTRGSQGLSRFDVFPAYLGVGLREMD